MQITCTRIYIIFDVYLDISNKNQERQLRGEEHGILYINMARGHRIMHWEEFLKSGVNNNNLIDSLAHEWALE